ncbi:hypothetical protein BCV39_22295 [Vibrio sp. 10N.286.55.E10]|uniref:coiled-coil domain-containing protein n=1 Tax=unclassified Vibrio TaxID=2614977 RepID=UPI000C818294|nr:MULTISPECIES: hypothetical protein [unclassified Vibrio]PME31601.1 hypothetical protein BCV39_22295 [Vibrio sp. 10N.286.55.E10]PME35244.1 hypothetical protein BCV40_01700 [Vibrio sp. 10N.286.55.E12]PME61342.1 hypothetical protein BCV32_22430 [Vibrio sp. 10N.286.55.C11]
MEKESINKNTILSIKNVRDVVVLVFLAVMTFKIFSMEITLNMSEFGFTDLLSIIVAFFSIALSVAFYFKATDTSNRFYDNSYAFTKEMSEVIGRMESGFGEKLKHLDEGYTGIRDKFDQLPFDFNQTQKELEIENAEIKKKEEEQRKTLEELAKKAHLAENEKQELFERMSNLSRELEESKSQARRFERQMLLHESSDADSFTVLSYVVRQLSKFRNPEISMKSPRSGFRYLFRKHKEQLHSDAIHDLERLGFIDEEGDLTRNALDRLRMLDRKVA